MDIHIGDLHSTIVDRELEIIQELLEEMLTHTEAMSNACDVCAELDCLLSLAQASRTNNYVRPEIVQDSVIEIVGGRHPLHEQILDAFVANDARLVGGAGLNSQPEGLEDEDDWNSILLCTGANACGKSVYMKQIALIQIMAQIGCFVPAERATLGIVDKIFTRVSTRESVSKAQSAFMIDLNQVSLALRNCTPRSLILLDEFGKGTLSTDGAGLFCGVLMHLLERGPACPMVLVATHFHEVFTRDLLDVENLPITCCHMQVMFTLDSDSAFKVSRISVAHGVNSVARGLSADSHAAQCAAMFGIPARIVSRAQHVSNLISQHEIVQLLDEEITEKEKEDLLDAEAVCKRFLEWDLDDHEGVDVKARLRWVLGMVEEGQEQQDE
ncbi:DNA mismatch repair protein Msh5 [Coprinopsis cinerea okayama7|uniref:DNA mismatch repair protein Msh5 n=1 Tax=Coprinopsis cinerea (strain Okayama-7 / 130 / ATCC MYA-4618 / FGSC 9003) TaxID=240176 RepID=D6RPC0_COPC7|nr:DNA mismatch repair protein Msh5 [Coprinopsis cinerea okayama7\|eukprot:XP_002910650.1 DNA mismatch repair protein Msh5 [Coprinopsis cinerea okayama7\